MGLRTRSARHPCRHLENGRAWLKSLPADFPGRDEIIESIQKAALINPTETLADVGNVAAFLASDLARTITATEINISSGALID